MRGGDRRDLAGTYVDVDAFTWDQGLRRLALGAVMEGARSGEVVEVASGLRAGDLIVSSGNFLIAAESRIRSAGGFWTEGSGDDHAAH